MSVNGSFEDQFAIRTLNESYANAVFCRDADAWAETWADNAEWTLLGTQVKGKANIVAMWQQAMAGFPFAAFFVQIGSLSVNGDRAEGVVYTQEVLELPNGTLIQTLGRYRDEYLRTSDGWRFYSRHFEKLRDITA